MTQATPAATLFRLLVAIILASCTLPAMAQPVKVHMRVISGGLAFQIPTNAYYKPLVSWDANLHFLVHVVVQSDATRVVDETSGRMYMRGQDITLCYSMRKINYENAPPSGATAFPEIMEFHIPQASTQKKYNVTVKQNCK